MSDCIIIINGEPVEICSKGADEVMRLRELLRLRNKQIRAIKMQVSLDVKGVIRH